MPGPDLCPPAHPPEAAELALLQAPLVDHTSDQGGKGAVRAVGTLAPTLAAPEPGAATDCPGARQAPLGQAWAPPAPPGPATLGPPRTTGSPPTYQKRISPPPDRRLLSAGLPRPAQTLSSAPLRSLRATARTPPPGPSATRKELLEGPRPFCDARGRSSEHAQEGARCGAGL